MCKNCKFLYCNLSKLEVCSRLLFSSFYVLHVFMAFCMLFIDIHFLNAFIVLAVLIYAFLSIKECTEKYFSLLILLYLTYWFSTIIQYSVNGKPIVFYIHGFKEYFLFVVVYFAGNTYKAAKDRLFEFSYYALLVSFVVGLFLHFMQFPWYVAWKYAGLEDWLGGYAVYKAIDMSSFSGFWVNTYPVGYLCVFVFAYSLKKILEAPQTRFYVFAIIALVVCALARQRVSFAMNSVVLLSFFGYSFIKRKKEGVHFFVLILLVSFVLFLFSMSNDDIGMIMEAASGRFDSMLEGSSMVEERSGTWEKLLSTQTNYLLGHGFNSGGIEAYTFSGLGISDGEFFKFFYEGGIVGSLLFIAISGLTILRGLTYLKLFFVETVIIVFFSIATLGANPFSQPMLIFIYWYSMGRIWNKSLLNNELRSACTC